MHVYLSHPYTHFKMSEINMALIKKIADLEKDNEALKKDKVALEKEIAALKRGTKSAPKSNKDATPGGKTVAAVKAVAPPPAVRLCKFGAKCTKQGCPFDHGSVSVAAAAAAAAEYRMKTPCRYGAGCTNPKCGFDHSKQDCPMTPPKIVD